MARESDGSLAGPFFPNLETQLTVMLSRIHEISERFREERRPFALATVVRVTGSASAKPGSKAIIDDAGRNVFGWVGGGCAETLVREEALAALAERRPRIVLVDLDDEVLGVGMPCGGNMEVYIEPQFPPTPLVIVGHNRLARHLSLLGASLGYAVRVHSPQAEREHFPTAAEVAAEPWEALAVGEDSRLLITADHEGQLPALRRGVLAQPTHLAMVARRGRYHGLVTALKKEGIPQEGLGRVRSPAGLDLGGKTVEEISLSIIAELLAVERGKQPIPLRMLKGRHTEAKPPPRASAEQAEGEPRLLVVGHGRIAEELARLGALMGWPVTVNALEAGAGDFPAPTRLVVGDLDFSRMEVTPETFVVIATLHKGDHLSMQKALEGEAAYIGLIASQKRSGLVLDYLQEAGFGPERMANVHAPAGLELGAVTPTEIAFSIMSEIVATYRGGSCRPLVEVEASPGSGTPDACRELFE
ncbi:MAG: XdhC family protein [SAR324 cluster bacterium]|nr:XdhC family protein [SAR324 cluster bacterium]